MRGLALAAAVLGVFALAGCAPKLPPWEEVRDEARQEMQTVVDMLPASSVEAIDEPIPNGWVSCDGGASYSGHWLVHVDEPSEVLSYVSDVRNQLSRSGYVEQESIVPNEDASFVVRTPDTDLLIRVSEDIDADEAPYVDILVFSRCGQKP